MVDLLNVDNAEGGGPSDLVDQQFAFVARLENVKILSQLLKTINFREQSTWFISANGIKVTVEDAKCVQSNAFIKSDIFSEFELKPGRGDEEGSDDLSFSINLNVIIECLNMFGGVGAGESLGANPCLKICYAGYGHPFILLLEEQGVINDSQIKTREPEDSLDFNFANAKIISKIILNSDSFKEVFSELDTSSDYIEFIVTPEPRSLTILTSGPAGECSVSVPETSDMVELFICEAKSHAKYRLSLMRHGIKPLTLSEKVSVRMDDREFLCLQYMVRTDQGPAFLEYYCAPEEDLPDR